MVDRKCEMKMMLKYYVVALVCFSTWIRHAFEIQEHYYHSIVLTRVMLRLVKVAWQTCVDAQSR